VSPPPGALDDARRRLADSATVHEAAEAALEACLTHGHELPSVYLERGGRLRCVAQRGYWQVFDGLAPGAGVLGSTYARGTTQVVNDPDVGDAFIRAIPTVVAEVAVPLIVAGQPAGVLSVESRSPLAAEDVEWVEALGVELGRRLQELGGRPREEPAEMLARFTYELACLEERDRVVTHTLVAALMVSGMRGACLFLCVDEQVAAAGESGRLGRMLATLGEKEVVQLYEYVGHATSSYAVGGEVEDDGFEATHILRDSGVDSLVVLALVAHGRREGMLVLVDDQPRPGIVELVPLLEMLAATATAMIGSAETRDTLQRSQRRLAHQARHDALTGLANRSGLLEQMHLDLDAEDRRAEMMVLFVDLDGFKTVNDDHGHRSGDLLLTAVADRLRNAARGDDLVARIGGDEFVVLCRGVRSVDEAATVGDRILERLAAPFRLGRVSASVTACIGIASAVGRHSPEDVIDAADRAMYDAKASGPGRWSVAPGAPSPG